MTNMQDLTIQEKQTEMRNLVREINKHCHLYYTLDNPIISDIDFDYLMDLLRDLEKETGIILPASPTQRVGGDILSGFQEHEHRSPLWSLEKANSIADLKTWEAQVKKAIQAHNAIHPNFLLPDPSYVVELKFDGLTLNLTYNNGVLVQAATRGNGITGEGVLAQVKTISSIPLEIPYMGLVEVQGEGIMKLSTLKKYNETAIEPLKNARNAVAGAIRNLNPQVTAERKLDAYIYNIGYSPDLNHTQHSEVFDFLKLNRFKVNPYIQYHSTIEDIMEELESIKLNRPELDYLIDGAVIKVCDLKTRSVLGYTSKYPKWAIAYKFEAEEAVTSLNSITWEVGRTGKITPVACLERVKIGGVTVSSCTLNNNGDIERKGLRYALGKDIILRRSNDVIPEILGMEDPDAIGEQVIPPQYCPSCHHELVKNGAHLFCTNTWNCEPQQIGWITHFASKEAMDIEGLSESTAKLLFDYKLIKDPSDLYRLDANNLVGLPSFQIKKAAKLLNAIEKSKSASLARFIRAISIPNVGSNSSKILADAFGSIERLQSATKEELTRLPDIGEIVAISIQTYFRDEKYTTIVNRLLDFCNPENPVKADQSLATDNIFNGKTVVITGTFETMKRDGVTLKLQELGAKVGSAVSKNTDFLIFGEKAGSKKSKAEGLGIRLINESELLSLI